MELETKLYGQRWAVLAVFSLISMTNEVIWISLSSITSIVQEYYRVDSIAVNWLSLIYLPFTITVFPCAYFLNKFGLTLTIIIGGMLNGIGSCFRAIGSIREGFVFVFIGNSFAAAGQSFLIFLPPHIAAIWFGKDERVTASSIGMLMTFSGVSVGFLLAAFLVPSSRDYDCAVKAGIQKFLLLESISCTFLALSAVFVVKDAPPTPPSKSQVIPPRLGNMTPAEDTEIAKYGDLGNAPETETAKYGVSENADASLSTTRSDYQTFISAENEQEATTFNVSGSQQNPPFKECLIILVKDKQFHLICHAYAFYFGLFNTFNIVLNQMLVGKYPGKETEIGYMGCGATLAGLVSMLLSGMIVDRTRCFKLFSALDFLFCFLSMLLFTLVLNYVANFHLAVACFCIFGFFSYPYISIGLEHAAEITYPVPAGISAGICLIIGSIYGIAFTYAVTGLQKFGYHFGGYAIAAFYAIGMLFVLNVKAPLKRRNADLNLFGSN